MKFCFVILLFFCIFLLPQSAYSQDQKTQVKAVFLFKFTDYISWPPPKNLSSNSNVHLCVWGDHEFGDLLEIIAQKQTKYHYKIYYFDNNKTPENCHILFTSLPASRVTSIKKTLLVSDRYNFANNGGMIEMREDSGKVKLIGNLQNIQKANLKISSRLLKIINVIR